ncbi:MAG: exodeoxyribonuclease VII large subunit [Cellvibrionaceae bacterium]
MNSNALPEKNVFSVSQLNRRAKQLLETHLPLIWVSGEISNLAKPSSGHWYFSLKDDRAQVRCAMFKNANQRLRWQPESGKQVLIRARVSLYEGRGEYQLIAEHMEDSGAGALQQAYEALKLKLQSEGLFDESAKQELPLFPSHIGVITSPTGAAVRDILSVLKRRYPIAPVTILPVAVQGENAVPEMLQALKNAEHFQQFDLLIIGRGGGSIEDLWAFNNEALARAISDCPIPTVSAVGHEVDFTICDFVSDVRAPTPSASAEIATPDLDEWEQALDGWQLQLIKRQQSQLQQKQKQLLFLKKRLRHPGERLQHKQKQIADYQKNLTRNSQRKLNELKQSLHGYQRRLLQQHPNKQIQQHNERLRQGKKRFQKAIDMQLSSKKHQLTAKAQLLNAVNPLDILARGYSIAKDSDDQILKNTSTTKIGDELHTHLAEGRLTSKITHIDG